MKQTNGVPQMMSIPGVKIGIANLRIKGNMPLLVNRKGPRALESLRSSQGKRAKSGKEAKNPEADYLDSIYFLEDGIRTGFPSYGIRAALIRAAKSCNIAMTDARNGIHVIPDEGVLVEILGEHQMHEDALPVGKGGGLDLRYRAIYPEWEMDIKIKYNAGIFSAEQIANVVAVAGFACGLGEMRPEKNNAGYLGTFDILYIE